MIEDYTHIPDAEFGIGDIVESTDTMRKNRICVVTSVNLNPHKMTYSYMYYPVDDITGWWAGNHECVRLVRRKGK